MRLNWFLPARSSNGNNGALRRMLGMLGPTWAASPLRRLVQVGFFSLFLLIFFHVLAPVGPDAGDEAFRTHRPSGGELFLVLDPLVSVSTAIASRTWVGALPVAAAVLAGGLVLPRGFCGYVCPMGTLIDLFDWAIGRRLGRKQPVRMRGWWAYLKYYVLAGVLLAAVFGVLISGFFSAIPLVTRAMAFLVAPVQSGAVHGWDAVAPMHAGHYVSIVLFIGVLGLGFLRPRFWCRYVCPTGALFSLVSPLRLTGRKVGSNCGGCGLCREACPFDAIDDDFLTRELDCTFCQTCGGVCPKGAIRFGPRWGRGDLRTASVPGDRDGALSRRGFLVGATVTATVSAASVLGVRRTVLGAKLDQAGTLRPVRPPGSVPEELFLRMCIRCQECTKACPTGLLQPLGFEQGLDGLWTVHANTDWAGCHPECNRCGEVCPTRAIPALPLERKKKIRMGEAQVDPAFCLPYQGRSDCELWCHQACAKAGHEAILLMPAIDGAAGDAGLEVPEVVTDLCVGCGMCQSSCYQQLVRKRGLLKQAAVRVHTGPGREDRLPPEGAWFERKPSQADMPSAQPDVSPNEPVDLPADAPATGSSPSVSPPAGGVELPDFMN